MTERGDLELGLAPSLPLCVLLVGGAAALALAARRAEPLLLALGPLLLLAETAVRRPRVSVEVRTALEPGRVMEGGVAMLEVGLAVEGLRVPLAAAVGLDVPEGVRVEEGGVRRVTLTGGRPADLKFRLRAERRGLYDLGGLCLRVVLPGILRAGRTSLPGRHSLEVLPRWSGRPKPALTPTVTGLLPGLHRSRRVGAGVELASLREYEPGDPLGSVDWRASARWARWIVRQRLASRNAEVVILLDALARPDRPRPGGLDALVRVAAALAMGLLERPDRVGLVVYGGVPSWVRPGSGRRQRWRLLRRLREAQLGPTYVLRDLTVAGRGALPPNAAVVAVTSLADERFADVVAKLKAARWPVTVVYVPPPATPASHPYDHRLAARLWALDRRILLDRLRDIGVAVVRARAEAPGARPARSRGPGVFPRVWRDLTRLLTALAVLAFAGAGCGLALRLTGGPAIATAVAGSVIVSQLLPAAVVVENLGWARGTPVGPALLRHLGFDVLVLGVVGGLVVAFETLVAGPAASLVALVVGLLGLVLGVSLVSYAVADAGAGE